MAIERGLNSAESAVGCRCVSDFGPDVVPPNANLLTLWYSGPLRVKNSPKHGGELKIVVHSVCILIMLFIGSVMVAHSVRFELQLPLGPCKVYPHIQRCLIHIITK